MVKSKLEEVWNLFWQWFFLIAIPSVAIILLKEFGKVIYETAGLGWAILFYVVGIIIIVADIMILINKTWKYLKPIIEKVIEIIETIVNFFRK